MGSDVLPLLYLPRDIIQLEKYRNSSKFPSLEQEEDPGAVGAYAGHQCQSVCCGESIRTELAVAEPKMDQTFAMIFF